MNTKILGQLTPKMVQEFIRNLQQNGYVRKGFFKVRKIPYFYTHKFEIKFWPFPKEYFVFETTGDTFSFMNVNESQSLNDIWLIFLMTRSLKKKIEVFIRKMLLFLVDWLESTV